MLIFVKLLSISSKHLSLFYFLHPSLHHSLTLNSKLTFSVNPFHRWSLTIDTPDWLPRLMGPFSVSTLLIGFYRATACNATHGIAVSILSVCLSVRRVYCDKTKWWTADILIPHDTAVTLVFWHQKRLMGECAMPPFLLNLRSIWPTLF